MFADELLAEDKRVDLLINNAGMLPPFEKVVNIRRNRSENVWM